MGKNVKSVLYTNLLLLLFLNTNSGKYGFMPKPVVVVIDMLNDFVSGCIKCERAQKIIPNLKRLLEAARRKKIPVIYANDAHFEEDFEVKRRWGRHAIKGTVGAKVIPELKPSKADYIIEKRVYSAFFETGLESLLRSLGADTVILGGLHTHLCVRHTAADAFFRGYRIIVAKDGVEALTERDHRGGLNYLKEAYGAEFMTVDELIGMFKSLS
jgi:nicotinamidase-related amidase